MSGFITFSTTDSPEEVADFYKEELAALGWKEGGNPMVMPELITLEFSKEARKLSITITTSEGKTTVLITETK